MKCLIGMMILGFAASIGAASTRLDIRLFDNWKFYRGNVSNAQQPSFGDNAWQTVSLPHSVNIESVNGGSYYLGYCWYRKHFAPDESFRGKKIFLEFEGAMQVAVVYLNGTAVISHNGGYSPFIMDITGSIQFGQDNVIAVQLNNSPNGDIPPGNSSPDFRYYGGLYRNVHLLVTDNLHITDPLYANAVAGGGVFVTYPSVSASSAAVQVKTNVKNEYGDTRSSSLQTTILTPDGQQVQTSTAAQSIAAGADYTFVQSLTVPNPRLWSPNAPNLYLVVSKVFDGARAADSLTTTIGIRTIQFTKANGLQINGVRCKLHGANRHQEYPYVGNAVPLSGQYRDARLLKEGGFSFVRMCHYIQPESFIDACDRTGIAAMACIPGWQYSSSSTTFLNNTLADVKTMVRWYRNHPSVVLWEIVHNESGDAQSMVTAAQAAAHAEYPGDQMYTCGEEGNNIVDVYMSSTQHGVRNYAGAKSCVISECGDWEYGGGGSSSRQGRGNGESGMLTQAANHIETLNLNMACSWFTADALWSMFDYCGFQVPLRSGTADIYRLPKFSYYFHQSQRDPAVVIPGVNSGPMVFIAGYWTPQSSLSVKVFSNCEQVSLYLNGNLVATRSPDNGSAVANLTHPPFTFAIPAFQSGTLRAEGKIGGTVKATHQVQTPGAAARISVAIDTAGFKLGADGSDFAIAYASVLDANGTLVPNATNSIRFSVNGSGAIIGTNPQAAEGGIATVLIQSAATPGAITVTAAASPLTSGTAAIASIAVPVYQPGTAIRRQPAVLPQKQILSYAISNGAIRLYPMALKNAAPISYAIYTTQGRQVYARHIDTHDGSAIAVSGFAPDLYWGQLRVNGRILDTRAIDIAIQH